MEVGMNECPWSAYCEVPAFFWGGGFHNHTGFVPPYPINVVEGRELVCPEPVQSPV